MNYTEFFSVQTSGKIRLETVSQDEAIAYAQKLYRADNTVIPDIIAFATRLEPSRN